MFLFHYLPGFFYVFVPTGVGYHPLIYLKKNVSIHDGPLRFQSTSPRQTWPRCLGQVVAPSALDLTFPTPGEDENKMHVIKCIQQ